MKKKPPREVLSEPSPEEKSLALERARVRAAEAKREAKRVIAALEKKLEATETRIAFLDALAEAPTPKPLKIRKRRGAGKSLPAAAYFMLASDWHLGERVRPESVGGRNEYNPEIAQERAARFFDSQLTMLRAARSAWDVRDGVLWLGGDLQTGYIHEEFSEDNFLSPTEEVLLAHEVLSGGLDRLLAESDLDRLVVVCNYGNHGRTGLRIRVSTGARNSFEWLLYRFLARTKTDPRLEWRIANGYHEVLDVYGFRVNFSHGDAIRYAGGVGGVSVPANRRIGQQAQGTPVRWEGTERGVPHLYVAGHFHNLQFPRWFAWNGSLIGWNAYAERIGAPYQDPLQASFVVDERYREVSNFNPIFVEKRRKK